MSLNLNIIGTPIIRLSFIKRKSYIYSIHTTIFRLMKLTLYDSMKDVKEKILHLGKLRFDGNLQKHFYQTLHKHFNNSDNCAVILT